LAERGNLERRILGRKGERSTINIMHPSNLPHKLTPLHNIEVEFIPTAHSGEARAWKSGEGVEI